MTRTAVVVAGALILLLGVAPALTWVETSCQDFTDGAFSDNLYASHRDSGTVEFEWAFDLDGNGYCDLMCADWQGPFLRAYFGDSAGYSTDRRRLLPITYGGGCDAGDLDCDGFPDLVHSGWHTGAAIFWGTDSGPSPSNPTELDAEGAETVTIDDLDRDGHIDLVFPGENSTVAIYWGGPGGYSASRRTRIPFDHGLSHNATIADLDKDGYRDIVLCMYEGSSQQPVVYFGANRTYRVDWLDYLPGSGYGPHGTTIADLDRDGWLDVVYSGYNNVNRSYIYFGSDTGFSNSRRTVITPGVCYGGSAACDFDDDGWLDLVYFRGDGNFGGYWKPIAFLNTNSPPYFSDGQTRLLGPDEVALSGGLAADFNRDGNLDVYLDGYDPYGSDRTPSMVLWGPDLLAVDTLPNQVDHHGMFREPGNVYDRSYREEYVSSVFDAGVMTEWQTITWTDSTPRSSAMGLEVRTGGTPAPGPGWSDWVGIARGDSIPDTLMSRYIQYRALMTYGNPADLPMLFEVRIDYGPGLTYDVGPTAILVPSGIVDSGLQVTPTVVVRNFGTNGATFPVTALIGSDYSQTLSETLAAGAVDTVSFPDWTAGPVGNLGVTCFTDLVGDEDPTNDTLTDSVLVRRVLNLDVCPVEILSPPGVPESGRVYLPSAMVRNIGRTAAAFPVTLVIGSGYAETMQETLAPGLADTVAFPYWTAEPVGQLAVTCFTALAGDEDPANDTIGDSVRVVGPPVHDVGAVAILAPPGTVRPGDTVIPRARIMNFGNTPERFFDVRFRVGTSYNRTANEAEMLRPDSAVELTFAPWVATSGEWVVSCSTMLASDGDRANDKVVSTVTGFEQLLHIEPDQSDRLEAGAGRTYQFHARIDGDTGAVVELSPPGAPAGWSVRLCDTSGTGDLTDTDADGVPDLGYVAPGDEQPFGLEVMTPSELVRDTALLTQQTIVVAGQLGLNPLAADTAFLNLTLVPAFIIHNFPNPFITGTTFVIGLPADGEVSLTVYTRAGERVCSVLEKADRTAGVHLVPWGAVNGSGKGVAPGTYEYVLDFAHEGSTERIRKRLVVTRE